MPYKMNDSQKKYARMHRSGKVITETARKSQALSKMARKQKGMAMKKGMEKAMMGAMTGGKKTSRGMERLSRRWEPLSYKKR